MTLEIALALLSLPREVGTHPEDGAPVEAGIGRYGPYVKHGRTYASLEKGDDVLRVGMNRAMELLARKAQRGGRGAAQKALRELGEHPEGGPVAVMEGRYGPYVKWDKVNATIPKDRDPQAIGHGRGAGADRGAGGDQEAAEEARRRLDRQGGRREEAGEEVCQKAG